MRTLKTTEAAALLNVNPNTLRAWERRFGFPVPERSCGGHRSYIHAEIETLAHLLREGVSIASAVSMARAGLGDESHQLVGALLAYEARLADALMEGALAIRPAERAVQEVLLPALARVWRVHGSDSAPWAFAARWSCDWLLRAQRFARDQFTDTTILIGDTTADLDPDAPYVRSLELFCALGGARVLALSVRAPNSVGRAVRILRPRAVVIAGGGMDAEAVARWTYPVCRGCDTPQIALYRRSVAARSGTGGVRTLPPDPGAAQRELVAMCRGQTLDGDAAHAPDRARQA
ncbi:MAG: MerR family transcriptional regulator [Chloroflexota bacterium]|nr:MerR family transcriptional regulator [Chloroflexota bacterium]